jgi:hypothetical protein
MEPETIRWLRKAAAPFYGWREAQYAAMFSMSSALNFPTTGFISSVGSVAKLEGVVLIGKKSMPINARDPFKGRQYPGRSDRFVRALGSPLSALL